MRRDEHTQLTCLRCGYAWGQRSKESPKQCPYCKSYQWQTAKDVEKQEAPQ